MRVAINIDPRDPRRDLVRYDTESWLRHHARDRWRVREDEDSDGRGVLVFEFLEPMDGMDFHYRMAPAEHRGRIV